MIRLGQHPVATRWRLIAIVTGGGSVLLAAPAPAVFVALGAGAWSSVFFVILFSIFLIAEPEPGDPAVLGIGVLAVGIAMEVWAVVDFIRLYRRRREDAEQLVLRGGWRVLPPQVRD